MELTDFTVRMGSVLHKESDNKTVIFDVQSYHTHQKWRSNFLHDIALIRLAQKVTFSDYVRPICLHSSTQYLGSYLECYTAGWGSTDQGSRPVIPDHLMELKTSFISDDLCVEIMEFHNENWFNPETMLCTGTESKTTSICRVQFFFMCYYFIFYNQQMQHTHMVAAEILHYDEYFDVFNDHECRDAIVVFRVIQADH